MLICENIVLYYIHGIVLVLKNNSLDQLLKILRVAQEALKNLRLRWHCLQRAIHKAMAQLQCDQSELDIAVSIKLTLNFKDLVC